MVLFDKYSLGGFWNNNFLEYNIYIYDILLNNIVLISRCSCKSTKFFQWLINKDFLYLANNMMSICVGKKIKKSR